MIRRKVLNTAASVLLISVIIILTVTLAAGQDGQILEENTELLFTYVVWRHGARTPVEQQMFLFQDPETLMELTLPYGFGALTNQGKQQGYQIGEFLRRRYNNFISTKYNSSEVYFRSTDVERTKMTGLTAMAALYPPGIPRWHANLAWDPVPYTTVPLTNDYMSSIDSCPRFTTYFYKTITPIDDDIAFTDDVFTENAHLIQTLTEHTGVNFSANPYSAYNLVDTYYSALGLGMSLPTWLSEIWDELLHFVDQISKKIFMVDEAVRLNAGVVFHHFLTDCQGLIQNQESPSQRVKLFSVHDLNVASVTAAAKVFPGYIRFAAVIALELRRVVATGEFVVLPVYAPLSEGSNQVEYLQVEGCSNLFCNFDEFFALTSPNAIEESVWEVECVNGGDIPLPT